jgi:hypothetical protein
MSTDRDVTRTVRSWLEEGVTALPDRVLDHVLDQLPATPQRRASWPARRFPIMTSNVIRVGVAAAVVVGLALVGLNVFGDGGRVGGPDPSEEVATASPSPSPSLSAEGRFPAGGGAMEPGTYTISEPFPVEIEFTLVEGWLPWTPGVGANVAAMYQGSPDPPAGQVIVFVIVNDVYVDPCDESAGLVDPGPTVADLAAALAGQPNTEATEPVDVTISGYSGVYIDYTASGGCGTLQRWPSIFGNREALPGERDQVWILDVDGVRLVIDAASFAGTEETDLAEMRTIIESLTITP